MSNQEIKLDAPDDYLQLKIGKDETRELFMSAALLRTMVGIIGTAEQFVNLHTDPEVQVGLMTMVLLPRDAKGHPTDNEFVLDSVPLAQSEAKKLLKWIEDHVLYFFIDSAETAKQSMTGPAIQKLMVLLNGLKDLQPEKQLAGPTTAEQTTT